MKEVEYILCHGSGNRFAMVDAVRDAAALEGVDPAALARSACRLGGGMDGLLLLVAVGDEYGMRMFNPDGSEAEMCGNGIRCVARLAAERYLPGADGFMLWSGGRRYAITREAQVAEGIPTFGVEIPIRRASADFVLAGTETEFIAGRIEPLDAELEFTYLNLGNPHITACVDAIDVQKLKRLGERVLELKDIFPNGVNVSLYSPTANGIFVATYERGVGITPSCGTAMTASSTAACLTGVCGFGATIDVANRGGMVRCRCLNDEGGLRTQLIGNATYDAVGRMTVAASGEIAPCAEEVLQTAEQTAYAEFLNGIK